MVKGVAAEIALVEVKATVVVAPRPLPLMKERLQVWPIDPVMDPPEV